MPGKDCAWVALAAASRCGLVSENDVAARDACLCACDPEGPTARPAPRPTRARTPPTAPVAAPTPRPSRPTVYKRPSTDPALSANGETTVTYNGKRNRSKSGDDMRDGLFVFDQLDRLGADALLADFRTPRFGKGLKAMSPPPGSGVGGAAIGARARSWHMLSLGGPGAGLGWHMHGQMQGSSFPTLLSPWYFLGNHRSITGDH